MSSPSAAALSPSQPCLSKTTGYEAPTAGLLNNECIPKLAGLKAAPGLNAMTSPERAFSGWNESLEVEDLLSVCGMCCSWSGEASRRHPWAPVLRQAKRGTSVRMAANYLKQPTPSKLEPACTS
mmetsp:Transcript_71344/g.131554  ORF Transcript_71344/g.131554 Transcript_71344/m.131554 type:complete len:124 (+) Transcript_71344:287-658(+)